jgi:hypothetical protein
MSREKATDITIGVVTAKKVPKVFPKNFGSIPLQYAGIQAAQIKNEKINQNARGARTINRTWL